MIRLFVRDDLAAGASLAAAPDQQHFLAHVMRVRPGEEVLLFNGRDGEWRARVSAIGRREAVLEALRLERPQSAPPDLELLVALVKRARLETIVEKAAELGAARVRPLVTERSSGDHTNVERLFAVAAEAAEQTGRLDVPVIAPPQKLSQVLDAWSVGRRLMFCDEAGEAAAAATALDGPRGAPWAILIGPEGGFSPGERLAVRALTEAVPVCLGPRILRADTAAIAAMTLWQARLGDWSGS